MMYRQKDHKAVHASILCLMVLSCFDVVQASVNTASSPAQGSVVFPTALESYKILNKGHNSFVVSVGTSMSQTHQDHNTVSSALILQAMINKIKKMKPDQALAWLKDESRRWYILRSLPHYKNVAGDILKPDQLDPVKDAVLIDQILHNVAENMVKFELPELTYCPAFSRDLLIPIAKEVKQFDQNYKNDFIGQLQYLGLGADCTEKGCETGLPNLRLSLEAADVLKRLPDGSLSTSLDPKLLQQQADFINALGNPLLFFHHYSNPESIPDLFESVEHRSWFAQYCVEVLKLSPQITHVCPISQPIGFAFRVLRGSLPPFGVEIKDSEYFENIAKAQLAATEAIKKMNPRVQVLLSHQWKPMQPKHNSVKDPRYALEKMVCSIAHNMYNGKFIKLFSKHKDSFDGIALSVYPMMRFNLWKPEGDNTGGSLDYEGALEAILQTAKAFSGKDIYVVETGCNSADPEVKKTFVDMTMYACRVARDMGVPIKGVYFWGITNDPDFYMEWNSPVGSSNFGAFDTMHINSINPYGVYLKDLTTFLTSDQIARQKFRKELKDLLYRISRPRAK